MRPLTRPALLLTVSLTALIAGAAITVAVRAPDTFTIVAQQVRSLSAADLLARAGVRTREITVTGRERTPLADLQQAVNVDAGVPLMALDVATVRTRIEALPWVARADVERRLPSGIHIRLTERTAAAIWQRPDAQPVVVDDSGAVLGPVTADFAHLIVVSGDQAPSGLHDLTGLLTAGPALPAAVTGATRFGARRWDIVLGPLDDGLTVRLPADPTEAATALSRLADLLSKTPALLETARLLDLRYGDRLILRLRDGVMPDADAPFPGSEKGTAA